MEGRKRHRERDDECLDSPDRLKRMREESPELDLCQWDLLPAELTLMLLQSVTRITPDEELDREVLEIARVSHMVCRFVCKLWRKFLPKGWKSSSGSYLPRFNFSAAVAMLGWKPLLLWAKEAGCPLNEATCEGAARGDQLELLKWLREEECDWDSMTLLAAAGAGSLEVIEWARENGCDWNSDINFTAATTNQLEVLEWVSRRFPLLRDPRVCEAAASEGHFELLQWA